MKKCLLASHAALMLILIIPVSSNADFTVQAGSFKEEEKNAIDLIEMLNDKGFSCEAHEIDNTIKVMCGNFLSRDEAVVLKKDLEEDVFSGFITKTILPSALSVNEMPSTQPSAPPVSPEAVASDISVEGIPLESPLEDEAKDADSTETNDDMSGQIDAEEVSVKVPGDDALTGDTSMAEEVNAREKLSHEAEPESEGNINGDVLEEGKSHIHPFLSIALKYTDNLFNSKEDRESDSGYIFSPGVWASVPASDAVVAQPALSVGAIGGRSYSAMDDPARRRFSGTIYYRGDAEEYRENKEESTISHTGEALLAYDSMNWVAVNLSAQYLRSHEERSYLGLGERGIYEGRRASGQATLGPGEKTSLSLGYTVFNVSYENNDDDYRERSDKAYNGQVSIRVKPNTLIFMGYQQSDVEYRKKEYVPGSTVKSYFAGIAWDFANKTRGIIRAGQSVKEFDEGFDKYNVYRYDLDERKTSIAEIQIQYLPSTKSNINLIASKSWKETDMVESAYIHSYTASMQISHRLTYKISSSLEVLYQEDEYEGDVVIGTETGERVDRLYSASVAFQFEMSRFHTIGLGYSYRKRNSSFRAFEYYTNTYFLRLTASL